MDGTVFGLEWADFLRSLKGGTISQPVLVRETEATEKAEWYLYAVSPRTLVQVLTVKKKPRSWRTVDGALADLERDYGELPPVTVYGSVDTVALK